MLWEKAEMLKTEMLKQEEAGHWSRLATGYRGWKRAAMELRQVQLFLAAAEEGSITGAARRMNLTQPGLSRQIKALEEELGVELFTRGAHSVALTPAGRVLAEEGGKLLERAERVIGRVRAEADGPPLRIGYAPSLAGPLLGLALERFSQLHPRVRVRLFDCSSAEMREGLVQGQGGGRV